MEPFPTPPKKLLEELIAANGDSNRYILEILPNENCDSCNESNIVFDVYSQKVPNNHNPSNEVGLIQKLVCDSKESMVYHGRTCLNCDKLQDVKEENKVKAPVMGA